MSIRSFVIALMVVLVNMSAYEFQTPFCDLDTIEGDIRPLPDLGDDNSQYMALIERNFEERTTLFQEIFDGKDNVGIIGVADMGTTAVFYYYYKTNELLVVEEQKNVSLSMTGFQCASYPLNSSVEVFSGGFQVVYINGQEHILSPVSIIISKPGFQTKYIGKANETKRGIPVDQWVTCLKSKNNQKSYRVTISFSDPSKFTPVGYPMGSNGVVPVEMFVEMKDEPTGKIETEVLSITNFAPFTPAVEEFYTTQSGVYCIARKPGKPFPRMPSSFVYYAQAIPTLKEENQREGIVDHLFIEYNAEYHLYGRVFNTFNTTIFEVRDYMTGLNYDLASATGNCRVSNLLPDDYYVQQGIVYLDFNDPNQFFNLTLNVDYQYVGTKRLESLVDTDVWIGETIVNGVPATLEWYFLSEDWHRPDAPADQRYTYRTPLMLKVFFVEQSKEIMIYHYNIFGYRKTDINLVGFDVNLCHPETAKQHFIFRLANDLIDEVRSNEIGFIESVAKHIIQKAKVTVMRVSRIELTFDKELGVLVFFTLFDRVKEYGPLAMQPMSAESTLDVAIELLNKAFLNDEMQIDFYSFTDESTLILPVVKDSLREIPNYEEGFVTIQKESVKHGTSGAVVAIVVIIITVLGFVGGYFLIVLHNTKRINIPYLDTAVSKT